MIYILAFIIVVLFAIIVLFAMRIDDLESDAEEADWVMEKTIRDIQSYIEERDGRAE